MHILKCLLQEKEVIHVYEFYSLHDQLNCLLKSLMELILFMLILHVSVILSLPFLIYTGIYIF